MHHYRWRPESPPIHQVAVETDRMFVGGWDQALELRGQAELEFPIETGL